MMDRLDAWLLLNLPIIGLGALTAICAFIVGVWIGMWIGERRRARLALCYDHLISEQCSYSKGVYIILNARRMFQDYRSLK